MENRAPVPYHKYDGEQRLDLSVLGEKLDRLLHQWVERYGKQITFHIEPGRYVAAESAVLLGTVHAVKYNGQVKYIGTDIGCNVLLRPILYDAWHDLDFYRKGQRLDGPRNETAHVVGNAPFKCL